MKTRYPSVLVKPGFCSTKNFQITVKESEWTKYKIGYKYRKFWKGNYKAGTAKALKLEIRN